MSCAQVRQPLIPVASTSANRLSGDSRAAYSSVAPDTGEKNPFRVKPESGPSCKEPSDQAPAEVAAEQHAGARRRPAAPRRPCTRAARNTSLRAAPYPRHAALRGRRRRGARSAASAPKSLRRFNPWPPPQQHRAAARKPARRRRARLRAALRTGGAAAPAALDVCAGAPPRRRRRRQPCRRHCRSFRGHRAAVRVTCRREEGAP